jgi:hypothetical protein
VALVAAWRHQESREGFETAWVTEDAGGVRLEGHVTAVDDGVALAVSYAIGLDAGWRTRTAHVASRWGEGTREVHVEGDGAGAWTVDGVPRPELDGCLDVDLAASACTNAFPVRRLGLAAGATAEAPAVYVTAPELDVQRLPQIYTRLEGDGLRFDYASPDHDFRCELEFAEDGLVVAYPFIAVRVL